MAAYRLKCLLLFLVTSEFLILDIVGQLEAAPQLSNAHHDEGSSDAATKELQVNYQLRQPHHIVKRKSRGGGKGFGFGKKGKSSKPKSNPSQPYPKQPAYNPSQPYPKQPAYNPAYSPNSGQPPAYPGTNSRPGAGVGHPSYPAGPPPPYSAGGAHHNMPSYPAHPPPAYPGYSQPGYGSGGGFGTGFGGKNYGRGGSGGLGRTLGSAGFGAVAGTALGAYGGYKLGRMVGGLGRNGHYGYYDDYGKYIRCDPPTTIKVDPETNISYIPLDQDYDKRCSYYDRRPPPVYRGYTNGAGQSMMTGSPINHLVGSIINFTFFENCHLLWQNAFAIGILALLL